MTIFENVSILFPAVPAREPSRLNPLVLAYIGDSVYDLYVRTLMLEKHDASVHALHLRCAGVVRAGAQARAAERLRYCLREEEEAVFRRARNAKSGTVPKHAELSDYHAATGFEAVLGYLYLSGLDDRLRELLCIALEDEL